MKYTNIFTFFRFLFILIILDFIITFFIFSKLDLVDIFYPNKDHRVSNQFYHHSFKANVDTYDVWGKYKYKFITNSLGFKDKKNRDIYKKTKLNKRILINGDSFVEGIGFKYEDTFVGLLDKYLEKKEIEILNAGVASQSPILYYKKIFHLLEEKKIKFDELILFLDISDIPDEYYYSKNYTNNEIPKKHIRDKLQDFLIHNSTIYLFFDVLFSNLKSLKNYIITKENAANFYNKSISEITPNDIDIYKSIHVKRGNWTHDIKLWEKYGLKGRELSEKYLHKLNLLLKKHKIKFSLVIYPWPKQIYIQNQLELHSIFWEKWSKENEVNFINLFKDFKITNRDKVINQYFIPGDVHWNKEGHNYIYELIIKYYFNDN